MLTPRILVLARRLASVESWFEWVRLSLVLGQIRCWFGQWLTPENPGISQGFSLGVVWFTKGGGQLLLTVESGIIEGLTQIHGGT